MSVRVQVLSLPSLTRSRVMCAQDLRVPAVCVQHEHPDARPRRAPVQGRAQARSPQESDTDIDTGNRGLGV